MIAIWDNGEEYSDHCIEFVDVGEGTRAAARIEAMRGGQGSVVAVVQSIDWYVGEPRSWEWWRLVSQLSSSR